MFPRFFKPTAVVIGLAESGLTTSTFIGQRRLDKIMSLIHAGDYLFIEFGHNDMGSLTIAEYQTNLTTFITRARSANAIPVLVTPTARRSFNGSLAVNTFVNANGDYVAAMKQVATNNNVQVIDLNAMTTSFIEALGPAGSAVAYWYHDGTQDNTHFSDYGAYEVARMVVEGVRTGLPALVPYLADDVTPFNPAVPDSFSSWNFPLSADTSVWHYNGTGIAGNKVLSQLHGESFVPVPASSRVFYTVRERGNLLFAIYSLDGKEISKKNFVAREANGSFVWGELGRLPSGIYFLAIKSNNLNRAKIRFLKF
jgi:lysophospholipase L1-like esterase